MKSGSFSLCITTQATEFTLRSAVYLIRTQNEYSTEFCGSIWEDIFFFKGLLVNKRGCNFNFRDCCNPSSLSSDNLNANCHATLINLSAPAFYLAYYELFLVQIFLHAKMSYLAWSLFVLSCFFSLPTFSIVSIFSSFLLLMTLSKNAVLFWWN